MLISHERLLQVLDYNPDTGIFRWKEAIGPRAQIGEIAGSRTKDSHNTYHRIHIDGRTYRAHRLAWFYVYAVWPTNEIDHINRNSLDNRVSNLRDATHSLNRLNSNLHRSNEIGHRNIGFNRRSGKYRVRFIVKGQQHFLGSFKTLEAAMQIRDRFLEARGV